MVSGTGSKPSREALALADAGLRKSAPLFLKWNRAIYLLITMIVLFIGTLILTGFTA
jgi:uncharacterized YccA/Bax inhibitor family protein